MHMPVQSLRARLGNGDRGWRRALPTAPRGMFWRRALVIGAAIALTAAAAREMHMVLGVNGLTPLMAAILVLFVTLFAWIALALVSATCGFFSLLAGMGTADADRDLPPLATRTALLMPTYNEAPARIAAALQVIYEELDRLGALPHFDLFILSDTTDPDIWVAEEAAFLTLRERTRGERQIFYRRRPKNQARKAGNIAEWVGRFGGAYDHMLVLDADSIMSGQTLVRLAGRMEAEPTAGLMQTLPVIANGETLFARVQQFAGRLYGPVIAQGIAWWHGAEGNYWGHNAIIRTAAFAQAAGLPHLHGRPPFGGHILSHDFVEAALLRRAGWAVHMMPDLEGSYEEGPPSLPALAERDRRWCQGNLQHIAVLPARGLHPISRLHLLMGIGSYITAPLWLLFLVLGIVVSLQSRFIQPRYFPSGPSLFPEWPVVDPVRSMWVFIGTLGVLLAPKFMSYIVLLRHPAYRLAFGGGLRALASIVAETVIAGLIAPLAMLSQSSAVVTVLAGRDAGWQAQARDDGSIPFGQVVRGYLPHTLAGIVLGVVSYLVSPALTLWMLPVLLGLALSVPLVSVTAGKAAGAAFRRIGVLLTPEENEPPPILVRASAIRRELAALDRITDGLGRLAADGMLLDAHLAMIPAARRPGIDPFDPALLLASAKLEEAKSIGNLVAGLSAPEKAALLGNRDSLRGAIRLKGRDCGKDARSHGGDLP